MFSPFSTDNHGKRDNDKAALIRYFCNFLFLLVLWRNCTRSQHKTIFSFSSAIIPVVHVRIVANLRTTFFECSGLIEAAVYLKIQLSFFSARFTAFWFFEEMLLIVFLLSFVKCEWFSAVFAKNCFFHRNFPFFIGENSVISVWGSLIRSRWVWVTLSALLCALRLS